jgi:hypothetical protein
VESNTLKTRYAMEAAVRTFPFVVDISLLRKKMANIKLSFFYRPIYNKTIMEF